MTVFFFPLIVVLFFISFTAFSYFNLKLFLNKYTAIRSKYLTEKESFLKQLRYFSVAEKKTPALNVLTAFLCGICGIYFKIGVFGIFFGAVIGWFLPQLFLGRMRKSYLRKMEDQLHSALILIGNGLKAGETLPQSLESIRNIIGYPFSQELDIILQQIKFGMSVENALLDMAKRIPLEELNLAVQAMVISLKTGANMPIALKKIAGTINQRELLHKKINALTVQGRAQGIIVGLLPFAIGFFLYLTNPSYIEVLFTTFLGHCVIAGMVTLEIFAFFAIKKICTVKF